MQDQREGPDAVGLSCLLGILRKDSSALPNASQLKQSAADLVNRGYLLAAKDQMQDALQAFEAALRLDPSCSQARYNSG